LPETYVEFSPSGRGLHVWGFGSLNRGRRFVRDGMKVEVYGDGRYLTVTGKKYGVSHRRSRLADLDLSALIPA
jgi:primase-polymerase (primpol)-like protein